MDLNRNTKRTFLLLLMCFSGILGNAQVLVSDSLALVAFYNATNGPGWTNRTNWLAPNRSVSTWYGVTVVGNRVTQLDMNPTSPPFTGNNLVGNIPTQIGNLTALTSLDLAYNQLSGSIPTQIGNLANLTFLNLSHAQLTGPIPSNISGLSNLNVLLLNNNQLSGAIPISIGNLVQLTQINLTFNNLSGAIPVQLGNLVNLAQLLLQNNLLTGTIPAQLGLLSKLTALSLSENQLSGTIPPQLGNLSSLVELNLTQNQLTGSIPSSLGTLVNLQFLRLNSNQLSGTVPAALGNLTKLQELLLSTNQLSGAIPVEIAGINTLANFQLHENSFTELPAFSQATLVRLTVRDNNLTFEDLEPNMGIFNFTYIPQKIIPGGEVRNLLLGSAFTKTFVVGGSANVYRWRKNNVNISGATSHTLDFASVSFEDAGTYELLITSPLVPGLTLQTEPTILTVIDIMADGQSLPGGGQLNFATTEIGNERFKELEIINSGGIPFLISGITLTGDFSLTEPFPQQVDQNSNATLTIRFSPTAVGARIGILTVFSNAAPVYAINLVGEGDAELEVFNVVTTNTNEKHDFLKIRNITLYPENRVSIFDRWGNQVYERKSYDNNLNKFTGTSDSGVALPEGTYYYVIDINKSIKPLTGFLFLRRN
jgi:gliding motility-associated-like protein